MNMKTKIIMMMVLLGLCLTGTLHANSLPIHIDPFNTNTYDNIVWGCRLSRCVHTYFEENEIWGGAQEIALVSAYTNWLATDGTNLIARWQAGDPITNETDKLYLPLAKTEFWNSILMTESNRWDGSKAYFRERKFPELTVFPEEERAANSNYQATIELGLPVLWKIYNGETLSSSDKAAFNDWVLARYCSFYCGGVDPNQLPSDSHYTFEESLLAGDEPVQGDLMPNVLMYKPETFWNSAAFSETNYFDVSLHLRAGKTNELLQQYIDYAKYFEPADTYPQVKPKFPAADAPDTDEYRTLYNFLEEENKPTLFGTWSIDNDEGNIRLAPRIQLLHRA